MRPGAGRWREDVRGEVASVGGGGGAAAEGGGGAGATPAGRAPVELQRRLEKFYGKR